MKTTIRRFVFCARMPRFVLADFVVFFSNAIGDYRVLLQLKIYLINIQLAQGKLNLLALILLFICRAVVYSGAGLSDPLQLAAVASGLHRPSPPLPRLLVDSARIRS